jgi:uncharacterized protein YuzE
MNVKYFKDTDTMYVQFADHEVSETREINENTVIDLDDKGNLVSLTIEHASQSAKIAEFSFQQIPTA